MTDLSAMLHLTKDEEQRLLKIAKERKKKKILDRINQLEFYVREIQKEILQEEQKLKEMEK